MITNLLLLVGLAAAQDIVQKSAAQPTYVSGGETTNNAWNLLGKPQVSVGPDGRPLITQGRISADYLAQVTESHVALNDSDARLATAQGCANARDAIAQAMALSIAGQMEITLPSGQKVIKQESSGAAGVPTVHVVVNPDCSLVYDTNLAAIAANQSRQLENATWNPYMPYGPGQNNTTYALQRLVDMDEAYRNQIPVGKPGGGNKFLDEMDEE